MLKLHLYVGCNMKEIQSQKEEHQSFQETAKVNIVSPYISSFITFRLLINRIPTISVFNCMEQPWS
jgi:hypothetical protein